MSYGFVFRSGLLWYCSRTPKMGHNDSKKVRHEGDLRSSAAGFVQIVGHPGPTRSGAGESLSQRRKARKDFKKRTRKREKNAESSYRCLLGLLLFLLSHSLLLLKIFAFFAPLREASSGPSSVRPVSMRSHRSHLCWPI